MLSLISTIAWWLLAFLGAESTIWGAHLWASSLTELTSIRRWWRKSSSRGMYFMMNIRSMYIELPASGHFPVWQKRDIGKQLQTWTVRMYRLCERWKYHRILFQNLLKLRRRNFDREYYCEPSDNHTCTLIVYHKTRILLSIIQVWSTKNSITHVKISNSFISWERQKFVIKVC